MVDGKKTYLRPKPFKYFGGYILVNECFNCALVAMVNGAVCKRCGHKGYFTYSAQWVSSTVWWNPATWGKGHWQKPPEPTSGLDEEAPE